MTEERGITKAVAKVCPCEACKKGRKEPSKIAPMTIHGYQSRPSGGWQKQSAVAEFDQSMFFGVELETTVKSRRDDIERAAERRFPPPPEPRGVDYYSPEMEAWRRAADEVWNQRSAWIYSEMRKPDPDGNLTAEEAVSLAEPIGFWHAKHDGSVSGPEFASLPGSLAYWYAIRPDLTVMFTALLHGGVRSHSGDTAGMHISMSVESFTDSDHLVRFAKLVNRNVTWSRRMSQRTTNSLSWCHLATGPFANPAGESAYGQVSIERDLKEWAKDIMRYGESSRADRYVAINAPGGGRLEFRLPRGTLRVDRFYKNLEWLVSMIEYTRLYEPTDAATYMRWVMGQQEYPDLRVYLMEKFRLEPTTEFIPELAVASDDVVGNMAATRDDASGPRFCGCGDGCYEGDCGACRDMDAYDDPEEDEDLYDEQDPTTCDCGLTHDRPLSAYQEQPGFGTRNRYAHIHATEGLWIGPERRYLADGTECEYDAEGNVINVPDDETTFTYQPRSYTSMWVNQPQPVTYELNMSGSITYTPVAADPRPQLPVYDSSSMTWDQWMGYVSDFTTATQEWRSRHPETSDSL